MTSPLARVTLLLVAVGLGSACYAADSNPVFLSPSIDRPTPTPTPIPPAVAPLTVALTVGRGSPEVGQAISFTASTVTPITSAAWNFGNGATQQTARGDTVYTYPTSGTFPVTVTVTASDGRTATDQQSVTVARRPSNPTTDPDPTPTPPNTNGLEAAIACTPKPAGSETHCQATVRYNGVVQPSSTVSQVAWDFGDGSNPATDVPVASHVYAGAGTYTVFAAVTATSPGDPSPGLAPIVSTTITIP